MRILKELAICFIVGLLTLLMILIPMRILMLFVGEFPNVGPYVLISLLCAEVLTYIVAFSRF